MSIGGAGSPSTVRRVARLSRPSAVDAALMLVCVGIMHLEIPLNAKAEPSVLGSLAIVAASVPVLFRRSAPLASYAAAFVLLLPIIGTVSVYNTLATPVVVCAYSVAERLGRRTALVVGLCSLPAVVVILQIFSPHPLISWGTLQNLALVPLPLAFGVAAYSRRQYTEVLVERAEAAERSREEEALRRVDEERLRIARDVHDVVAHAMVTINVQAGVGAHLIDRDPAQAHDTLRTIKQVSGEALTDLRSMLGILRTGEDAELRPVLRLADLAELRESLGAAGVELAVEIDPDVATLPASVDATAYRIAQEALTNTLRHAGPTRARLRVSREDGRVLVEVVDDGGESSAALEGTGSGNGLRGMRERALAAGGTLEAGPRPGAGWRVSATLPTEVPA
jgi:signal transduction histidine kinase